MIRHLSLSATLLAFSQVGAFADPATALTVGEGFTNPVGFHDATPTFSWKLPEDVVKQSAYRLEVKGPKINWDSGWVESGQSVYVPYKGKKLQSGKIVSWRVDYKDQDGKAAGWSKPASIEFGLLSNDDWKAEWIRPKKDLPELESVSHLRRDFDLGKKIKQARLHVTGRGIFDVYLNGQKVGKDLFAPGWTAYRDRLDTHTYDVTADLKKGDNTLGAMLGTGWYAGRMGLGKGAFNQYGSQPELLLQLEVTHADGSTSLITSDDQWKATFDGPIKVSGIYDGETYDARKELKGWAKPGFDDSKWMGVLTNDDLGPADLTPKPFPASRVTEIIQTQKITEPKKGHWTFDLGQNMVGYPEMTIPLKKGQKITMRFAEMLNDDGTVYTENYRSAKSTNYYTAGKDGTVTWHPTFTFHGFRYVEITGLDADAKPEKDWLRGLVIRTDIPQIGTFTSSHPKLNQLQSNIMWGQRGNFLEIPTDCPQRNERLGWTGDAQVFCATAMFNFDTLSFWKSWLDSMRDEQLESGRIPSVVPNVFIGRESPGWMDAATIIPWDIYVRTGDTEVLSNNLEMMEGLVGFYRSVAEGNRVPDMKVYGDWLQPNTETREGDTPAGLLSTAFWAHSSDIVAKTAAVLGDQEKAAKHRKEAAKIKKAFSDYYLDDDGKLKNSPETQTAYVLIYEFDLVDALMKKKVASHLVRLIGEADGHLRTGFLGTPYIVQVLDNAGYDELAYSLVFKETYPSWFYSINQGATTMWERWDSYTKKDGFHPQGMNSFNHYAYGAIGEWMYQRIAGLAPDDENPGYRHFFIQPIIGGPLNAASAKLETSYGTATSSWTLDGKTLKMDIQVPPNTSATVKFPNDRKSEKVKPGKHSYTIEL